MHTKENVSSQTRQLILVEKIKEGLIHNSKVKRAYYRTLKREEAAGTLSRANLVDDEEVFSVVLLIVGTRSCGFEGLTSVTFACTYPPQST
jgi:hypothetical protein